MLLEKDKMFVGLVIHFGFTGDRCHSIVGGITVHCACNLMTAQLSSINPSVDVDRGQPYISLQFV